MTTHIQIDTQEQAPSRWQTLTTWLTAVALSIDYDPQEYNDASIKQLREVVTDLEARILELEKGHPAAGDNCTG